MTINNIISEIELVAALAYQEEYDNSGLITGQKEWVTSGVLFSLDCTEEVVDEAIRLKSNLIVAHHPIVFSGLKKLYGTKTTKTLNLCLNFSEKDVYFSILIEKE
jgi:putative NIF3 family GTP cyclohydrolase 1 type 2